MHDYYELHKFILKFNSIFLRSVFAQVRPKFRRTLLICDHIERSNLCTRSFSKDKNLSGPHTHTCVPRFTYRRNNIFTRTIMRATPVSSHSFHSTAFVPLTGRNTWSVEWPRKNPMCTTHTHCCMTRIYTYKVAPWENHSEAVTAPTIAANQPLCFSY